MAILATGSSGATFKLDGNEYSKGLYETTYRNISTLPDGESDEKTLEVGLINVNTGVVIQEPIQIRAWKNNVSTPYLTLDSLISALATIAGIGSSDTPVLSSYPTTDVSKVGQKFIYQGNEWKYHSQAELDELGWTSVSEGFPAPVTKVYDMYAIPLNADNISTDTGGYGDNITLDALGLGRPDKARVWYLVSSIISTVVDVVNFNLLTSLEDEGTRACLPLGSRNMTKELIDKVFTDLPTTTKTATIIVSNNPGTNTCDPSIATAKGYTVITA